MPDGLTFTFHGARGSVAIDRPDSARYGGSTISISARLSDDHYLILDAGTGLRDLQHHLAHRPSAYFLVPDHPFPLGPSARSAVLQAALPAVQFL